MKKLLIGFICLFLFLLYSGKASAQTCGGSYECCKSPFVKVCQPVGCNPNIQGDCTSCSMQCTAGYSGIQCAFSSGSCGVNSSQCTNGGYYACSYTPAGGGGTGGTGGTGGGGGSYTCNGTCHSLANCGQIGYANASGTCPSGQVCCAPNGGPLPHQEQGAIAYCQDPGGPIYVMPNVPIEVYTRQNGTSAVDQHIIQNTDAAGLTYFGALANNIYVNGSEYFNAGAPVAQLGSFNGSGLTLPTGQSYSNMTGPNAINCQPPGDTSYFYNPAVGPPNWYCGQNLLPFFGLSGPPYDYQGQIAKWGYGWVFAYSNCSLCNISDIASATPTDGQTVTVATVPASITISWTAATNATQYDLELYPAGTSCSDPNALCQTAATGNPVMTNSFTFTATQHSYTFRVRGEKPSCAGQPGNGVGNWTNNATFSIGGTVSGTVYNDPLGSATIVGGYCTSSAGLSGVLPGAGTGISAVNSAGTVSGAIAGNGTYSLPGVGYAYPTTVSIAPTDATYTCICPVGCSYSGVLAPKTPVNFYVAQIHHNWFQTQGGDIEAAYVSGSVNDQIPSSCTIAPCIPAVIAPLGNQGNGTVGTLITSPSSIVDTSDAAGNQESQVGPTGASHLVRLSAAQPACKENYSYFYRLYSMGTSPKDDFVAPANPPDNATKPTVLPQNLNVDGTNKGAYYHNGNMTIQQSWTLANTDSMVIFVHGNLTITNGATITMPQGAFLSFIVSGNITIDSSVGNSDVTSTTGVLQGAYLADGTLTVQSTGASGVEKKFIGEGTFAACQGISLPRDYRNGGANQGIANNSYPTSLFIYRPDLVTNTPLKMKQPTLNWHEIAP